MSTTTNKYNKKFQTFFCKLLRIIKFFFPNLLRKAPLEPKGAPTNRKNSAFLYTLVRPFPNLTFSSNFS